MIILYPTETLYALGVNALDEDELKKLFALKGREIDKTTSWLVRDVEDIQKYAEVGYLAAGIAERFLPGALTLVLKVRGATPYFAKAEDGTVGFRISSDPLTQKLIADYMKEYDAPLTCTSANISGAPTLQTPGEILQQLGVKAKQVGEIVDGGPRKSLATTIVRVIGDEVTILREGDITEQDIFQCVKEIQS
jgi:L-threonylcarbamoyladenylate synthase